MATRRSHDPARTRAKPPREAGEVGSSSQRPTRRRPGTAGKRPAAEVAAPPVLTSDARRAMIAEAAYLRAERRGFVPGFEEDDWLTAEQEVDALLSARHTGPQ